jgi:hypothetical protein
MGRSVYSLVLIDEIVEAVDKLAYEKNTSRSNLINQILAKYFCFNTPEMRMREIFENVEQSMCNIDCFQIQFQPSSTMISIRSALRYRYKPTIRYMLELYRLCEPAMGELRVTMRTQNSTLIDILTSFFEFWSTLENKYIGSLFPDGNVFCSVEPGKYLRQFILPQNENEQTNDIIASAISNYIYFIDSCLKLYFSKLDNLNEAAYFIENKYCDYLKNNVII